MTLGLSLEAFTLLHVIISLIGIATGLVFLYGLLARKWYAGFNSVFLWTTVLTSITGFMFPFEKLLPSHIVGVISLIDLSAALLALHVFKLIGRWRLVYAVTAMIALYFNIFVLVVQAFLKVPGLHVLAPTQAEPPFAIAQGLVLILFAGLSFRACRRL